MPNSIFAEGRTTNEAIENGLNNYMSQKDMLNIFILLFKKEILNEELCNIAIDILYNQRCQNQIMRYIYEPIKFAHKTGSLDYLNHDVGVMNINNKMVYIGISIYNSIIKNEIKIAVIENTVNDFSFEDEYMNIIEEYFLDLKIFTRI